MCRWVLRRCGGVVFRGKRLPRGAIRGLFPLLASEMGEQQVFAEVGECGFQIGAGQHQAVEGIEDGLVVHPDVDL